MDKAELIRHEIEKRRDHNLAIGNPLFAAMAEEDIELLSFIDSLQGEPVRCDFEMALAEMIDKAQKCVVEPWVVAAQWKDELVKLAKECKAMQEHPKDCMYSKDNYTDEDRKILCEGCEEECRFNKED